MPARISKSPMRRIDSHPVSLAGASPAPKEKRANPRPPTEAHPRLVAPDCLRKRRREMKELMFIVRDCFGAAQFGVMAQSRRARQPHHVSDVCTARLRVRQSASQRLHRRSRAPRAKTHGGSHMNPVPFGDLTQVLEGRLKSPALHLLFEFGESSGRKGGAKSCTVGFQTVFRTGILIRK